MTDAMGYFIATQNIAHFKALLQRETHPDKRRLLLHLLANEAEKLPEPVRRAELSRTKQLSIT